MRAPPWITDCPHQLLTEMPSCEAGHMTAPFPRDDAFEKRPCLAGRSTYAKDSARYRPVEYTTWLVLAVCSMAPRASTDRASAKSRVKPAENADLEPTGRPFGFPRDARRPWFQITMQFHCFSLFFWCFSLLTDLSALAE